jgi:hypothetical protein
MTLQEIDKAVQELLQARGTGAVPDETIKRLNALELSVKNLQQLRVLDKSAITDLTNRVLKLEKGTLPK